MTRLYRTLSLCGAVLAVVTVASAWSIQNFWPYYSNWSADFNLWVGRALWTAAAILAIAILLGRRHASSRENILRSGLLIGVLGVGFFALDLRSSKEIVNGKVYSVDWTTPHVSEWRDALKPYAGKKDVHALEIGTFEGRSAIWFLQNVLTDPSSTITCVDVFDGEYEKTFDRNVATFGRRITKIKSLSQVALRGLNLERYDFVYIDGSHIAKDVLIDAMLSWDLVKPGGVIIFDDYELTTDFHKIGGPAFRTKIAIDAFLHVMEPYVDVLHKGYQVVVKKRTEINLQSAQVTVH